jgi:predicted GH43/DUF377 family glycosyl hydrolase
MKWEKQELIFKPDNQFPWMKSHAQVPTVLVLDDMFRIYFATRDANQLSHIACIDVDINNPAKVLKVHDKPVLERSKLGAFDEDGTVPSCVMHKDNKIFLYYNGWNKKVTTPYHNAIGVAVSEDNGATFARMYDGPIIDRTILEPYMHVSPSVIKHDGEYKMWYVSGTEWSMINNKPEPIYVIRYAESKDGINWKRDGHSCLPQSYPQEAIATPSVLFEDGRFKMWYCFRDSIDFRDGKGSYRMGYAESHDGKTWERLDHLTGLTYSAEGWDSKMQAYPYVVRHKDKLYMFYSGNGFGSEGIGYASVNL